MHEENIIVSFIIVSAETEYISTRSWYRNINLVQDKDKDDVSGNQNNCYWQPEGEVNNT